MTLDKDKLIEIMAREYCRANDIDPDMPLPHDDKILYWQYEATAMEAALKALVDNLPEPLGVGGIEKGTNAYILWAGLKNLGRE